MEVDAAVGVASLVIQLCDVLIRVYGKYCDQKHLLIHASDAELETELAELRRRSDQLRKPPDLPKGSNSAAIEQLQEDIFNASLSTCRAVDKFYKHLDELRPKPGQSKVDSLIKASKAVLNEKKFKSIKEDIYALRSRTNSLMASLTNEKSTLSLQLQQKILDNQTQQSALTDQLRDDIVGIFNVEFDNIRKLIVQQRSGRSTVIESNSVLLSQHANPEQTSLPVTSFRSTGVNEGVRSTVQDLPHIIDHARQCLHFNRLSERQSVIQNAHFTTFNWIFTNREPAPNAEVFAPFPIWLERGHGCYWIQGKAGSGKSTLMKRIHEHEETQKCLERWSGNAEAQSASYFFWYLGSSLQKTLEGMIRSLLYKLLEKSPQKVITDLPELFVEAAKLEQGMELPPPRLEQLLQWFQTLVESCEKSQTLKVCFFVDGLDECSGNQAQLVEFFLHYGTMYKSIKFVLASRPLPVFTHALSHLPGLRVQDLTRDDIRDYTQTLLSKRTWTVQGKDIDDLVSLISSRSQGVFLWVAVVVQSVLEGLRGGDDMLELQQRIRELPEELSDLYKRMLEAIDVRYRPQAATMLLLVATNFSSVHSRADGGLVDPLSAVQLSFALEGCENSVAAPIKPLADEELKDRVIKLEPRLRSRCLGLIELSTSSASAQSDEELLKTKVVPFHRTAVEFLVDEEVSRYLEEQAGKGFDPLCTMFCSCIRMVKIATSLFSRPLARPSAEHALPTSMWHGYGLYVEAEQQGSPIKQRFVEEFDRVMETQWRRTRNSPIVRKHEDVRWFPALSYCKGLLPDDPLPFEDPLEELARDLDDELFAQLERRYQRIGYFRIMSLLSRPEDLEVLLNDSSALSADDATFLLRLLIQSRISARNFGRFQTYFDRYIERAISALLQAGADPNATDTEDHTLTLWTRLLVSVYELIVIERRWLICADEAGDILLSIIEKFVAHGADLSARVPIAGHLAEPSLFLDVAHRTAALGESISVIQKKHALLKEPLLRAARILRAYEERAGLHSWRYRILAPIRRLWKDQSLKASVSSDQGK